MGQTTALAETCIELIKYPEFKLWATIYEIYWDFHPARKISMQEKNP